MTDQVSGSSLPQTRDLRQQQQQQQQQEQDQHRRHSHPHSPNVPSSHHHNYNRDHNHNHNHNHHQHLHHARSQQNSSRPHQRDTSDDNADSTSDSSSDIVVVVETISVLQVTDASGATIIKTLPHDYPSTPVITDSRSESTVASSTKKPSSTNTDLPHTTSTSSASNDGNGVAHPSSSSSSTVEDPTVTPSGSSMPTSFPTLSYASITATPLSAAPIFPSLSGHSNSTFSSSSLSSASGNSSASLHSFTSTSEGDDFSILGGATGTRSTSSHPSSSIFTQSPFGTSTSKSSPSVAYTYFTSTAKPEATTTSGGDGIGSPADTGNGDGSAATSGADSSSRPGNTSAATIAGSVVGAISGLAIILLLAATFLKWKKRKSSMKLIQESGNDRGYGAMITGGSGGPSGGNNGMSEHRRPIPFAIPAALANLTSQGRFSRSTVSSNGAERGFTKVSGRKLPPVIQFGGDGYTDPRATMMSDQSIDYRASQNFFGEAPLSRLAVGAPMFAGDSTLVFHASPARTAITTSGPFGDPFSDENRVESPTMPPDPVGRSHLTQDRSTRSHGSFSRFTEDL